MHLPFLQHGIYMYTVCLTKQEVLYTCTKRSGLSDSLYGMSKNENTATKYRSYLKELLTNGLSLFVDHGTQVPEDFIDVKYVRLYNVLLHTLSHTQQQTFTIILYG